MEQKLDLEIYQELVRYVGREISLKEFRDWFDASTWGQDGRTAGRDLSDLASEVELRLAEFSNGDWTEEELRDKLAIVIHGPVWIRQAWGVLANLPVTSSASATDFKHAIAAHPSELRESTKIRFEVVFG